jgi:ABC-type iron transport system FetAB permease component
MRRSVMKIMDRMATRRVAQALVVIVALGFSVRFSAIGSGFAIDDYVRIYTQESLNSLFLSQGRWGSILLFSAVEGLGLGTAGASVFFDVTAIIAHSLFVGVTIIALFPLLPRWSQLAGAAVILAHPYWSEIHTFKVASLGVTLTYSLLSVVIFLSARKTRFVKTSVLVSSLILTFVFSMNQSVLNLIATVLFVGVLVHIASPKNSRRESKELRSTLTRLFLATSMGGVAYVSSFVALRFLSPVELSDRTSVLSAANGEMRFEQVVKLVSYSLFGDEPIFPFGSKVVFLTLYLFATLAIIGAVLLKRSFREYGILLALAIAFPLATTGVIVILEEWWPTPRVLQHQGLLLGLVFLAGLSALGGTVVSKVLASGSVVALLIGSALSAQVFFDQRTVNRLDWATANQMNTALQAHEGYESAERLVFYGKFWRYQTPLKTTQMDMNISAFGATWSQRPMYEYATGRRFAAPTPQDRVTAEDFCSRVAPWPNPLAVSVIQGTAVVCLSE